MEPISAAFLWGKRAKTEYLVASDRNLLTVHPAQFEVVYCVNTGGIYRTRACTRRVIGMSKTQRPSLLFDSRVAEVDRSFNTHIPSVPRFLPHILTKTKNGSSR